MDRLIMILYKAPAVHSDAFKHNNTSHTIHLMLAAYCGGSALQKQNVVIVHLLSTQFAAAREARD